MIKKVFALLTAVAVASPAAAQVTTYASRVAWTPVANPTAIETFGACGTATVSLPTGFALSSANPGPCASLTPNATYRVANTAGNLYISAPGQSANPTTALGVDFFAGDFLEVSFGSAVRAFGADLFQNMGGGQQSGFDQVFQAEVVGAGGNVLLSSFFNIASSTGGFFGITSDQDVFAVRVRQQTGFAVMDNVAWAPATVVPEPSTWALLVTGLGALGVAARRRRSA